MVKRAARTDETAGGRIKPLESEAVLIALKAERARLEAIKDAAARPFGTGGEIVDVAPARGPVAAFQPREAVRTADGNVVVVRSGHNGQGALRRLDAFDVMLAKSAAHKNRRNAEPLFSLGQVMAGREYAALVERCAAAGVKCSSLEGGSGGASGGGSWIEAVMHDSARLQAMRRAIGTDHALLSRDAQAHADRGHRPVRTDQLVDLVCLGELTLNAVLLRFGWARATKNRERLAIALCGALDRMSDH